MCLNKVISLSFHCHFIHGRQILYTHRQNSNTYPQNIHTYNSQGELILNSRQTVAC